MYQSVKARIYPTDEQTEKFSQFFGCARWWWNRDLIDTLRSKDTLDSADRVRLSLRPSNAVYLVTNRQAIVTSYFCF